MKLLTLTVLAGLLLSGCTTPRPMPLTQADVISMTKAGLTDEEIMRRIDGTATVFRLGASDVVRLRTEGVSERVVNYMLETYPRAVAAEQQRQDYYQFHWYAGPYHGYRYWH
jgi:hypothetical protein